MRGSDQRHFRDIALVNEKLNGRKDVAMLAHSRGTATAVAVAHSVFACVEHQHVVAGLVQDRKNLQQPSPVGAASMRRYDRAVGRRCRNVPTAKNVVAFGGKANRFKCVSILRVRVTGATHPGLEESTVRCRRGKRAPGVSRVVPGWFEAALDEERNRDEHEPERKDPHDEQDSGDHCAFARVAPSRAAPRAGRARTRNPMPFQGIRSVTSTANMTRRA